jgi:hypothetical protein
MFGFILGALTGGIAAWWWRRDIEHYVDEKLPNVREKAAERLSVIEQRAEEALGRAKQQIDRMRPAEQSRPRDVSSGRGSSYTQGPGV